MRSVGERARMTPKSPPSRAPRRDQHVAGVDAAVQRGLVGVVQGVAEVGDDVVGALKREGLLGRALLLDQLAQALALDELEGDVAGVAVLAHPIGGDDVLVDERRGDLHLGAQRLELASSARPSARTRTATVFLVLALVAR